MWAEWFARGVPATRAEVLAAIESGMPLLAEPCRGDRRQLDALDRAHTAALRLVPAS
jgi:hypothetical protein